MSCLEKLELDSKEDHTHEIAEIYSSLALDGAKARAILILSELQVLKYFLG